MIEIEIDESIRKHWVGKAFLAVVDVKGVADRGRSDELEAKIDSIISELRMSAHDIFDAPMIRRMRVTFRSMPSMDPSRYRPASESLIRRSLDKGLFRISPLVDTNNILSVQLRVPLGIYDVGRFGTSVWTYRIGRLGETYATISGQLKSAEGKLVIADSEGVIGSPVADSARAAIKGEANNVMVIAYLPLDSTVEDATLIAKEIEVVFARLFQPDSINIRVLI